MLLLQLYQNKTVLDQNYLDTILAAHDAKYGPPLPISSFPSGSEDWAWLIVRWMLKQPLRPAIDEMADEEVRYLVAFIEGMQGADWGVPPDPGNFWYTEVLPQLRKGLTPKPMFHSQYVGPDEFQSAKANTDIVEFATRFTELNPAGSGKVKGLCPLHAEKTASFYIYAETQRFHCYGACGRGGDVIELGRLLMEVGKWQVP